MKRNAKKQGEAAEIAFLWKATQLGLSLSKPYGDSEPYDFVLDAGRRFFRLQVKTSAEPDDNGWVVNTVRSGDRLYQKINVHFFIVWLEAIDLWYVIPREAVGTRKRVRLNPHWPTTRGRFECFREAWHLLRRQCGKRRFSANHPPDSTKSAA